MNGDGKPEILLSKDKALFGTRADIMILKNLGTPGTFSFAAPFSIFTYEKIGSFEVRDMNLDGKPDIVGLCNICGVANGYIVTIRNTSTSSSFSFEEAVRQFTGVSFQSTSTTMAGLQIADLNKDGKPEVAVGLGISRGFFIYKNTSSINSPAITLSPLIVGDVDRGDPYPSLLPLAGDFESDGIPDLVTNRYVYKNDGNYNFTWLMQISYGGAKVFDLNGDGKPDIAGSGPSGVAVIKNTSSSGNHFVFSFCRLQPDFCLPDD